MGNTLGSKWLNRTTQALLLGFLILLSGLFLLKGTLEPRLVHHAQNYLRSQGLEVEFDSIQLDWFDLSSDVSNIQASVGPNLPPFFQAERLLIEASPLSYFQGKPLLQLRNLRRPVVQVILDEAGRSNLPTRLSSGQPQDISPTRVAIDHLEIGEGRFLYHDESRGIRAELVDLTLEVLYGDVELPANLSGQQGTGTLEYRSHSIELTQFEIQATFDSAQGVELERLTLGTAASTLSISGRLSDLAEPTADLDIEGALALNEWSDFLGTPLPNATTTVQANLVLSNAQARFLAQLTFDDLELGSLGQNTECELELIFSTDEVQLQSLIFRNPSGSLEAEGSYYRDPSQLSRIRLQLEDLDLLAIAEFLPPNLKLAGRGSGEFSASWPELDFSQVHGNGHLKVTEAGREVSRGVLPIQGEIQTRLSSAGIEIGVQSLILPGVQLSGDLTIEPKDLGEWSWTTGGKLSGEIRGDAPNLGRALFNTNRYALGTDPRYIPWERLDGTTHFEISLSGSVGDPGAKISVRSDDWTLGTLSGVQLSVEGLFSQGELKVEQANLVHLESSLNATGSIRLYEIGWPLQITASFKDWPVFDLFLPPAPESGLGGSLAGNWDLFGTFEEPQGKLRAQISDFSMGPELLGSLSLQAAIDQRRLHVESLSLSDRDNGFIYLESGGFLEFSSRVFEFQGRLQKLPISTLSFLDGPGVEAIVSLQSDGKGTLEEPSLDIRFELDDLRLGDNELGGVQGSGQLNGTMVSATFELADGGLHLEGAGDYQRPYPVEFEARFEDFDTRPYRFWTSFPLQVLRLTGGVSGSGDLASWTEGRLRSQIEALSFVAAGQEMQTIQPLQIEISEQRLFLRQVELSSEKSWLRLEGEIPLAPGDRLGQISLQGDLDLVQIFPFLGVPGVATGLVQLEGRVRGDLTQISPALEINGTDLTFEHPSLRLELDQIQFASTINERSAIVRHFQAGIGTGTITGSATLPLSALITTFLEPEASDPRLELEVAGNQIPIQVIPGLPADLSGSVSAQLRAQKLASNQNLTGELRLEALDLDYLGRPLSQIGPSVVTMDGPLLSIVGLVLEGPATQARLSGNATLPDGPLDLTLQGQTDTGLLISRLVPSAAGSGQTAFSLEVSGQLSQPLLRGFFESKEIGFRLREPRLDIHDVDARLELLPAGLEVKHFTGEINGGHFELFGRVTHASGKLGEVDISVIGSDHLLTYPDGLRAATNLDLFLRGNPTEGLVLGGNTTLVTGSYITRDAIDRSIFPSLNFETDSDLLNPSEASTPVRFDMWVQSANPLLLKTPSAEMSVNLNLRLVGSYNQPILLGQVNVNEGGQVVVNGHEFLIERGNIAFQNRSQTDPELDVLAVSRIRGYDINMTARGPTDNLQTNFVSDPSLSEPDIISLLVTGRTLDQIDENRTGLVTEQSLAFLSGNLGSLVGRHVGLSRFRVEPNLITSESDPGARLTVGEDITSDLHLTYSMNLANGGDQIYIADYDVTRGFNTRGVVQTDNSYRFEFNHDLRPGSNRSSLLESQPSLTVGSIGLDGFNALSEAKVRNLLQLKENDRFDFLSLQRGFESIEDLAKEGGLLESRLQFRRVPRSDNLVDLEVSIREGPLVSFEFPGYNLPKRVQEEVRNSWTLGVSDRQRLAEAQDVITKFLHTEGFLQADVDSEIVPLSPEHKQVVVHIRPGFQFKNLEIHFNGAVALPAKLLRSTIREAGLEASALTQPEAIERTLGSAYRQRGYLEANISAVELELDVTENLAKTVVTINEGPLYRSGTFSIAGSREAHREGLLQALYELEGQPYEPSLRRRALSRAQDYYLSLGYLEAQIDARPSADQERKQVHLELTVQEGERAILGEIRITGNRRVSQAFILGQLRIAINQPLDRIQLDLARKRLFDSGSLTSVEFTTEPIAGPGPEAGATFVRLLVSVRESIPYRVRYGGFFDTERGLGVTVDFTNRNWAGGGRLFGMRGRYDDDIQEVRAYVSQPFFRGWPLNSNLSSFLRRERRNSFSSEIVGISFQQQNLIREVLNFSYGYRFERNRTFDVIVLEEGVQEGRVNLSTLNASFSRDTRNSILDAHQGSFLSQSLELAPRALGSEIKFIRYFGQYFRYLGFGGQHLEVRGVDKSLFTFASGVRLGLAKSLGEDTAIPPNQLFFAGGGTTIRGFGQDEAGPLDLEGNPLGGNALFVLNNELRFPLPGLFSGVAFLDLGNVYSRISDFDLSDVRSSAGLGLRVRTPYFLLRFDYGFKLDRRVGENPGAFFFSIGQAF